MCPRSGFLVPGNIRMYPRSGFGTREHPNVIQALKTYALCLHNPKDPAILKLLRVVNLVRVVNLLSHCDLLYIAGMLRHFPGNYRHFSSERRVCGVENMGVVVKTLLHSHSLMFAIVLVFCCTEWVLWEHLGDLWTGVAGALLTCCLDMGGVD